MRYSDVRDSIQTGDIIQVRRRSGALAVGTTLVTHSPYTHTGLALWCGGRLLIAQINGGGNGFAPLSQQVEFGFDVFPCPVDREAVEKTIWQLFGSRATYGFTDLARIALYLWLNIPLPKQGKSYICSALVAKILIDSGWTPERLPSIPWPGAIVDALHAQPIFTVRSV